MKKNLMFFALGVSTTLLMGAGISYWNEIRQENKYGVLVNSLGGKHREPGEALSLYPKLVDDIPYNNKYGVLINSLGGTHSEGLGIDSKLVDDIPYGNKYALIWDGEIGNNAKKAMVVGFIHGIAVGKEKAKMKSSAPNSGWRY